MPEFPMSLHYFFSNFMQTPITISLHDKFSEENIKKTKNNLNDEVRHNELSFFPLTNHDCWSSGL